MGGRGIFQVGAKKDVRATYGINTLLKIMLERSKLIKRKLEKYTDMENSIRREMDIKKIRIFKQQKHYTKKAIYLDEIYDRGIPKNVLKARAQVRENRLEKLNVETLTPKNALIPRLQLVNWKPEKGLTKKMENIQINVQKGQHRPVRRILANIAVSDMEEVQERQRFLKYDNMWARAEQAFLDRKKEGV